MQSSCYILTYVCDILNTLNFSNSTTSNNANAILFGTKIKNPLAFIDPTVPEDVNKCFQQRMLSEFNSDIIKLLDLMKDIKTSSKEQKKNEENMNCKSKPDQQNAELKSAKNEDSYESSNDNDQTIDGEDEIDDEIDAYEEAEENKEINNDADELEEDSNKDTINSNINTINYLTDDLMSTNNNDNHENEVFILFYYL
jgi:hypothetical protein